MLIYRHDKGAPLTSEEIDGNFYELASRLRTLEDHPAMGEGIGQVRLQGHHLTFTGTFGTDFGTFSVPQPRLSFRGAWQPQIPYERFDFVSQAQGLYCCVQDHSSGEWDRDRLAVCHEMLSPPLVFSPLLLYERETLPLEERLGKQALFAEAGEMFLIFFDGTEWQRLTTGAPL